MVSSGENIINTRGLGFEIIFAPTDNLHLLNEKQTKECFNWLNNKRSKRINDWPGWEILDIN